ncbi:MAG TPA: adenylyl-sulfate kinase [Draconibacterium sp.]|nr:adenylyl-sulfate kinase [Draconibacterium sp.]
MTKEKLNITPVSDQLVSRIEKEKLLNQKSKVIWFTGLSGSGKTTLAMALEKNLYEDGFVTQILDGDNIRSGINNNLGFSPEDRMENVRRIAEVAKLLLNSGVICICAFVSPTEDIRNLVREIVGENDFLEIFMSTPLEVCETRDVKGLYQKARAGEIKNFTGISAPFEIPQNAVLSIDTSNKSVEECVNLLLGKILPEITLK